MGVVLRVGGGGGGGGAGLFGFRRKKLILRGFKSPLSYS